MFNWPEELGVRGEAWDDLRNGTCRVGIDTCNVCDRSTLRRATCDEREVKGVGAIAGLLLVWLFCLLWTAS